jgi:radical SAM superfamily enzyme YgiQ (UPF0313 family)
MKRSGIRLAMFTSDNFNKYEDAPALLQRMIEDRINIPFFVQCDTQVARQEEFIELLGRAGCFQMFVGVESFQRKTLLAAHKTQNHPDRYGEIRRLCRRYGIGAHFSNIIGFPDDTAESIRENFDILRGLDPDAASFYILTPIPGTEQYDDFLAAGLITESNLDRFDGTTSTWRHPNFSQTELDSLLFECYRRFFSAGRILRAAITTFHLRHLAAGWLAGLGLPLFSRYSAWKGMHPMSGGVGGICLDSDRDYAELRKGRFGVHLAPLPDSLPVLQAEASARWIG